MMLAFVLGPMLENNLSKALIMSRDGQPDVLLLRDPSRGSCSRSASSSWLYPLVRWAWRRLTTGRRPAPAGA